MTYQKNKDRDANVLQTLKDKKKGIDRNWTKVLAYADNGIIDRTQLVAAMTMCNNIDQALMDKEPKTDWQVREKRESNANPRPLGETKKFH